MLEPSPADEGEADEHGAELEKQSNALCALQEEHKLNLAEVAKKHEAELDAERQNTSRAHAEFQQLNKIHNAMVERYAEAEKDRRKRTLRLVLRRVMNMGLHRGMSKWHDVTVEHRHMQRLRETTEIKDREAFDQFMDMSTKLEHVQRAQNEAYYTEQPHTLPGGDVARADNGDYAACRAEAGGAGVGWQQVLDEQTGHVVWRNTTTGDIKYT